MIAQLSLTAFAFLLTGTIALAQSASTAQAGHPQTATSRHGNSQKASTPKTTRAGSGRNPLYEDSGNSGTNPLFEDSKTVNAGTNPRRKHMAGVKYEDRTAPGKGGSNLFDHNQKRSGAHPISQSSQSSIHGVKAPMRKNHAGSGLVRGAPLKCNGCNCPGCNSTSK